MTKDRSFWNDTRRKYTRKTRRTTSKSEWCELKNIKDIVNRTSGRRPRGQIVDNVVYIYRQWAHGSNDDGSFGNRNSKILYHTHTTLLSDSTFITRVLYKDTY